MLSSALSSETLLVNKRELARILGVSVVTVNAYLDKWEDFPVAQRGTNGKEWQFNPDAVKLFMAEKEAEADRIENERNAQIAQLGLGLGEAEKTGEAKMSPTERLAYVRSLKAEDEIAVSRGYLVQTGRIRSEMNTAIGRWNKALHAALRQAGRDLNLPDAVTRSLEDRLSAAQKQFVEQLQVDAGEELNGQRSFA